ncbi:MAG TPA: trehalose-phosphatase [Thermomicrobiales bacterium]|nr:trehalose-phosphatase [Thermomicrobiales bacterium]
MRAADRLLELAEMGRMAIYADIDGTICPIAATPSAAILYPGAAAALDAIRRGGVRVVAISGRAAEDARRLVGLPDIDYAGNHGFELMTASGRVISEDVAAASLSVEAALGEVTALAAALPDGILIEDKAYTASIHYRLTKDPGASAVVLKAVLSEIAERHGLLLTEGRLVFELRPRLDINKGVFVTNDVRLHGIKTAAFLGDDITDLDGFRALRDLTGAGELLASVSIGVQAPESPARLLAESDILVDSVAGMVVELQRFADALAKWSRA